MLKIIMNYLCIVPVFNEEERLSILLEEINKFKKTKLIKIYIIWVEKPPRHISKKLNETIQSDLKNFEGNITLSNHLGLSTSGNISLTNFDNFVSIDEIKLKGDNASLSMNGIYQKDGQFKSSIKLTDFDINQWIKMGN